MTGAAAYARLLALGVPVVRTAEAAAALGLSPVTTAQTLRRLVVAGLLKPLRHGQVWVPSTPVDPWVALEHVSAPYPAYASLYSALFLHGVLSQVPSLHYAVTLGRTQRLESAVGTYSLHQVAPESFGGFSQQPSGPKIATVEKALFDLAYLGGTRSRAFARPPELELPRRLDRAELERWLGTVAAPGRAAQVRKRLNALLGPHRALRPHGKSRG